jgi:hypothetical protein
MKGLNTVYTLSSDRTTLGWRSASRRTAHATASASSGITGPLAIGLVHASRH